VIADLEHSRTLNSLSREELDFLNLGLLHNFGFTVHPFASAPDWLGVFNEPDPVPYGDLLPSSATVIQAWNHCEKLFSEAS